MSYTKQHDPWVDDVHTIFAADMNGIEAGIATAQLAAEAAQATANGKADPSSIVVPYVSPKVGHWVTAPDVKTFNPGSNQTRSTGNGPWLSVPVHDPINVDALACYVGPARHRVL